MSMLVPLYVTLHAAYTSKINFIIGLITRALKANSTDEFSKCFMSNDSVIRIS